MEKIPIKIKRLRSSSIPLPEPATPQSAGLDLRADINHPITIQPGETVAVPTGLAISLPDGYEAQVRPRSGLALKQNLGMLNAPGTIDADYRGEIKVLLTNFGSNPCTISPEDRVAQMVFSKVYHPQWEEVQELPESKRGSGGFGHSGK